jgi:hypothetical protein
MTKGDRWLPTDAQGPVQAKLVSKQEDLVEESKTNAAEP